MKITNKMKLPRAFVEMARSDYEYKPKRYSVTSLLKSTREAILERRHHKEIEQDVSDMIWLLFGRAAHNILENQSEGDYEIKEAGLQVKFGDYTLSGRFDLYDDKSKTISDYKVCSVWKVIYGNFDDWRRQLLIYAYMMKAIGFEVNKGEIVAIMRDHSKRDAKYKKEYPRLPVKRIKFKFTKKDFAEIEKWLEMRFKEIEAAEQLDDDDLPLCTSEERFNSGDTFAVMRKGRKTALRVLGSMNEAREWMKANGGDYIDVRPGEDKKCIDYCRVCEFCNYYKEQIKLLNKEVS